MLYQTAAVLRDSANGQAALGRIAVAIVEAALTISPEVNTTANYANRQKWVATVLASAEAPYTMARTMFIAVATTAPAVTDLDVGTIPNDADLLTTVLALVNTFAGRV